MRATIPLALRAPWLLAAQALLLLAGGAQAQEAREPPVREQVERRLQSVGTLIETSSVARQIEASGEAAAREKRNNARLIHREAAATLDRGDAAGASRLLDAAAREMMGGARLAKPEQVAGAKQRRDYDARLDSARALLAAQQRITAEKGSQPEAVAATQRIEAGIADAERQAAAGQLTEARAALDRAYLVARVSIEALRRGDTLVRTLKFANAREEYAYELDRYDTHRMLIQVLLADRPDAAAGMRGFVDKAAELRTEAEAQAAAGEHATAIKRLEEATRQLARAVRLGGIYIPL
ncbi:MAG: hypothetical protein JNM33_03235 [Rubrivivax sp.]|nr:hypothetical protein [Rubrivivax sp.]